MGKRQAGSAWAAAGTWRVLGTLRGSRFSRKFQKSDLRPWKLGRRDTRRNLPLSSPYLLSTLTDFVDESTYLICTPQQPSGTIQELFRHDDGKQHEQFR